VLIRLADVKVPRSPWFWVIVVLLRLREDRRTVKQGAELGRKLGEIVVDRWRDTDASTEAVLKLNRTMVRLTWAVVGLTVVGVVAALHSLGAS
jgi:hypothetical protein